MLITTDNMMRIRIDITDNRAITDVGSLTPSLRTSIPAIQVAEILRSFDGFMRATLAYAYTNQDDEEFASFREWVDRAGITPKDIQISVTAVRQGSLEIVLDWLVNLVSTYGDDITIGIIANALGPLTVRAYRSLQNILRSPESQPDDPLTRAVRPKVVPLIENSSVMLPDGNALQTTYEIDSHGNPIEIVVTHEVKVRVVTAIKNATPYNITAAAILDREAAFSTNTFMRGLLVRFETRIDLDRSRVLVGWDNLHGNRWASVHKRADPKLLQHLGNITTHGQPILFFVALIYKRDAEGRPFVDEIQILDVGVYPQSVAIHATAITGSEEMFVEWLRSLLVSRRPLDMDEVVNAFQHSDLGRQYGLMPTKREVESWIEQLLRKGILLAVGKKNGVAINLNRDHPYFHRNVTQ